MDVSFLKEDYFASSDKNSDFWQNIAETTKSEFIIYQLHILNKLSTYEKIINQFKNFSNNNFDSIATVTEIRIPF